MIEFKGICKSFFGNMVLKDISFEVKPGEILALAGQNGAGKSTLMKILSGVYTPEKGELLVGGKAVKFHDATDADEMGIGIVYQELSGAPHLSVSDNVVLGKDPRNKFGLLDFRQQHAEVSKVFEQLGVDVDLNKRLESYPASMCQLIEIAKCIYKNPKVVVFDEPTTSLTIVEREKLFEVMNKMRDDGLTIIFITHYLEEIVRMADKCVVLKDGAITYYGSMDGMDEEKIVGYMIGQNMDNYYPEIFSTKKDEIALEIKGFGGSIVAPTDLRVHYGEVLGIGGLIGSGRTELMHMIIGAVKPQYGEIYLDGNKVEIGSPGAALKRGIAYINEDRRLGGLNLSLSIGFNIVLPGIAKGKDEMVNKLSFVREKNTKKIGQKMIEKLEVKCNSVLQKALTLSGGNQQKVAIAKWIASDADIYIFDEPTKGIDVLTKSRIYDIIRELASNGKAVIVISSYNPELIGVCDRIVVMSKGKMVASFDSGVKEHELLLAQ